MAELFVISRDGGIVVVKALVVLLISSTYADQDTNIITSATIITSPIITSALIPSIDQDNDLALFILNHSSTIHALRLLLLCFNVRELVPVAFRSSSNVLKRLGLFREFNEGDLILLYKYVY